VNKRLERIVAACLWALAGGIVCVQSCLLDAARNARTIRYDIMDDVPLRPPCLKPMGNGDREDCPRTPD